MFGKEFWEMALAVAVGIILSDFASEFFYVEGL